MFNKKLFCFLLFFFLLSMFVFAEFDRYKLLKATDIKPLIFLGNTKYNSYTNFSDNNLPKISKNEKWYALIRDGKKYSIKLVDVNVKIVGHDSYLNSDTLEISVPSVTGKVIFLAKGEFFKEGPIDIVFDGSIDLYDYIINKDAPYENNREVKFEFTYKLKNKNYKFYSSGQFQKYDSYSKHKYVDQYFVMKDLDTGLEHELFNALLGDDKAPHIYLIGDIDRDGKLDILADISQKYSVSCEVLFLSSLADQQDRLVYPACVQDSLSC